MKVADLFAALRLVPDAKSFASADNLLSGVKSALIGIVSIASVHWAKNQITQIADLGDKLDEMTQKTGVPVETLQELGYVASFSGVSLDAMGMAMGKLATKMNDASEGGKSQKKLFKDMNVEYKNADGTLRPLNDVFGDVAEHISAMPDGAKKSALAVDLFSRTGKELIPVLNEGKEGIEKLSQEARDFGVVMSGQDAAAMAEFNDNVDRLGHAWQGVKILLAKELVPVIGKLVKRVMEWVKANRKLIATRIATVLKVIGTGIMMVAKAVGFLIDAFTELMEIWDGMKVAIGILIGMFLAFKLASLAAAVASTIAWVASLWPYALIALAIGAVLLILQDLWVAFKGGPSIFKQLYEAAEEWLGESTLGKIVLEVIHLITEGWKFMIEEWIGGLKRVWNFVKDLIGMIGEVVSGVKKIAGGDIAGGGKQIGGGVGGFVYEKSGAKDLVDAGKSLIQGDVVDALGHATDAIPGSGLAKRGSRALYDNTLGRFISYDPGATQMSGGMGGPRVEPTFNATFNVNSQTGDPKAISAEIKNQMDGYWDEKMREIDINDTEDI